MASSIINPSTLSSFSSSLLLSLVLTLLTNGQSCILSCVATQTGCNVCFNECPSGSSNSFTFDSCSQTVSNQPSSANSTSTTLQYDLNTCARQCCGSQLSRFQNPQLAGCPLTETSSKQVVIIVISVVVIIFVTLCCIVSGNSHIRQKIIDWITRKNLPQVEDKTHAHSSSLSISNLMEANTSKTKIHKKLYNFKGGDSQCSICLDHSSNTSTKCGHPYHISCLYQWIIRKEECPLCKSKQVQKVYVFCKKCKSNRTKVALKEVAFLGIKELNDFQCKQCRPHRRQ